MEFKQSRLLNLRSPDPPILAFFDFLAFFRFRFSLLFGAFFLSFPRILGVPPVKRKKPLLFSGFPCFFSKKKQGLVRGSGRLGSSRSFLSSSDQKVPLLLPLALPHQDMLHLQCLDPRARSWCRCTDSGGHHQDPTPLQLATRDSLLGTRTRARDCLFLTNFGSLS